MILNQAQAEAAYAAMCELNNVGGRLYATFVRGGFDIVAAENKDGSVEIWTPADRDDAEHYETQSAFAAAYGLETGAPSLSDELSRPLTAAENSLVDEMVDDRRPGEAAA